MVAKRLIRPAGIYLIYAQMFVNLYLPTFGSISTFCFFSLCKGIISENGKLAKWPIKIVNDTMERKLWQKKMNSNIACRALVFIVGPSIDAGGVRNFTQKQTKDYELKS